MLGCRAAASAISPEKGSAQSDESPILAKPAPLQARLVSFQPLRFAMIAGHASSVGRPWPFMIESPIATTTGLEAVTGMSGASLWRVALAAAAGVLHPLTATASATPIAAAMPTARSRASVARVRMG